MREALVSVLVLTAAFAGCLGAANEPVADDALALPGPVLPAAYGYACPPGGEERDGLCVSTLAMLTESLQEPYVAADPTRPGVYAVGVNGGHFPARLDPARGAPGVEQFLLDVFFTEDGGATWRLSRIPRVDAAAINPLPVEVYGAGDPALAFDEKGVLHVSGIATPNGPLVGYEVFYASTPDLGETWTAPVVFGGDDDNDRNWITVAPGGRVFVPWQNVGDSSEVAWSLDGGATWRTQERGAIEEDCITVSPVQMLGDEALLACAGFDAGSGELTGIRVLAFDPQNGTFSRRGEVEGDAVWPHLRLLADGRTLVLVYEDWEDNTVAWTTSTDAGRTWSAPADARDALTLDDAWSGASMWWTDADPWGGLHLVVGGFSQPTPLTSQRHLVHAVLDPLAGALLSEKELPALRPVTEPPQTLANAYGDHYYGLAFTDEDALLVWTRDRTLQFTRVVPELPGLAEAEGETGGGD